MHGEALDPRLEAELDALLELAPGPREQAISELAERDPDRAAALRRWLQAIAASEGLLEPNTPTQAPPERLGPWKLGRLLGRGGSGEVYLGSRADGAFERVVAVKLLRADRDADWLITAERQLLARLQHPNIAGLLDGGVAPDGRPWLVLEHVEGVPLDQWLGAQPSFAARIELFLALCDAVACAHAAGIVHADLKPTNVLVTATGSPKLLDFGIARLAELEHHSPTRQLTPLWAAPEQLAGGAVSARTDVYALGLLLYLLLTDRLPFADRAQSWRELEAERSQSEPLAPSRCAGLSAARRRRLRGDLDAIVLKCLARDPEARYASVRALLADCEAWRSHRPVAARGGGLGYRAARYVRRHWLALSAGSVVGVALIGGSGLALWQAWQAHRARSEAQAVTQFLTQLITASDLGTVSAPTRQVNELLRAALTRIEAESLGPVVDLELLLVLGQALLSHEDFVAARRALDLADRRADTGSSARLDAERETLRAQLAMIPLDYAQARAAIERARAGLGPTDWPENLRLVDARLAIREGDYGRALRLFDGLVEERTRRYGPDDVRTLAARLWRVEGRRLHQLGRELVHEAEQLLADGRRLLAQDHPLLGPILTQAAFLELDLHVKDRDPTRLQRAETQLEEALAHAEAIYGGSSLAAINAYDGMALLALRRGEHAAYRQALARVHAAEVERFGADSPRTLLTLFNIGMSAYASGEREVGARDMEAAIAAVSQSGARGEVARMQQQYALLSIHVGEHRRGLELSRLALSSLQELSGSDPSLSASLHRARARAHLALGDGAAALEEARLALARSQSRVPTDEDDLARSHAQLARVLLALGDLDAARTEVDALAGLRPAEDAELAELRAAVGR